MIDKGRRRHKRRKKTSPLYYRCGNCGIGFNHHDLERYDGGEFCQICIQVEREFYPVSNCRGDPTEGMDDPRPPRGGGNAKMWLQKGLI